MISLLSLFSDLEIWNCLIERCTNYRSVLVGEALDLVQLLHRLNSYYFLLPIVLFARFSN